MAIVTCEHYNREDAKFCDECGVPLTRAKLDETNAAFNVFTASTMPGSSSWSALLGPYQSSADDAMRWMNCPAALDFIGGARVELFLGKVRLTPNTSLRRLEVLGWRRVTWDTTKQRWACGESLPDAPPAIVVTGFE